VECPSPGYPKSLHKFTYNLKGRGNNNNREGEGKERERQREKAEKSPKLTA